MKALHLLTYLCEADLVKQVCILFSLYHQTPTTTPSTTLSPFCPVSEVLTNPGLTSTPLLPVPSHSNSYVSGCPKSQILVSSASAMTRTRSSSLSWSDDVGFAQGKKVSEKCSAASRMAEEKRREEEEDVYR
jgi:hypothetical protein